MKNSLDLKSQNDTTHSAAQTFSSTNQNNSATAQFHNNRHDSQIQSEQQKLLNSNVKGNISPLQQKVNSTTTIIQRRTLAQAGLDNGMPGNAGQAIAGGNVGPLTGVEYTADLGAKADKPAALDAAADSYGTFAPTVDIDTMLSRTTIVDGLRGQNDTITAYISGLEGDANTSTDDAKDHIKTNILRPVMVNYKTDVTDGELTAILTAMRNNITKNGNNKFFGNPKGQGDLTTYVRARINAEWQGNANVPPVDPFLYRVHTTVNGNTYDVKYQHSPDWPGYVTGIVDDTTDATMRIAGQITNPDTAGIPNEFGRKHHGTGNANLASDLDLDATDPRVVNERRLDSMTKLAGEGARFECVRNNIGRMTDNSRFYVMLPGAGDGAIKYVTLEDLWSSWAPAFNKANKISNNTVINEIVTGSSWTYNFNANQEAKVFDANIDPPLGAADVHLT